MNSVQHLQPPDAHHLRAAQGWLELGNTGEANEELEQITPAMRTHPDVLEIRFEIYAKAKKWEACVDLADAVMAPDPSRPFGWIHRSFALHELKRTQEAFEKLLPAANQFPKEWVIPYNLACYCAQLSQVDECKAWFQKAMAIDNKAPARAAVDDPDLKPLWDSIGGTSWTRSDP